MKLAFSFLLFALSLGAHAQLRLPSLPQLPSLPSPSQATEPLRRELAPVVDLVRQRQQRVADMLRERSAFVEADPAGQPIVRGELVLASPDAALLAAARAQGFGVVRERRLDALDLVFVTLRAPAGWDTPRALQRLRELDPQASVDFNHLYLDSGAVGAGPAAAPSATASARHTGPAGVRLGLIDGGVETAHPVLRDANITAWGCGSRKVPSAHGTAVASLLVGRGPRFRGAAPNAALYAADVYCNDPIGGSIEAVAAALAWLLSEQVPVVNISLVGPPNRTLEQVVRRAAAKGMLLVAAVGNDGPAAAPLYPAAYPEVVAVTGVDARGQVLPEACRGPHVAFAAPGAEMAAAGLGADRYTSARGTSFAAPLVAGMLAASMRGLDPAAAGLSVAALARLANDSGSPGRDAVYGHGLVARELRIDPAIVQAR
jgi:subtilisin family serine protease